MKFTPHNEEEKKKMLEKIGITSIDELFSHIPPTIRLKELLSLPPGATEVEVVKLLNEVKKKNKTTDDFISFLGAGAYDHAIPTVISHITSRSEYYTAYTPYQAEVSQGTLQTIFEYQSLICALFNMDISNASMYDGAQSLAEACLMAVAIKKKNKILACSSINPLYLRVIETYIEGTDIELKILPTPEGKIDLDLLKKTIDTSFASVVVQHPNLFGLLEPVKEIEQIAHNADALFVVSVDPISLGILSPPGDYNADIAVGEGQSLGIPLSFGGPYLGIFTCKKDFVRFIPGRLVGKTVDLDGNPAYVLTLQTREQHIKRERATSNICTNEALCALAATIYLSLLGKEGLKEVATQSLIKAHYLLERIEQETNFRRAFSGPFFKEFTLKGKDIKKLLTALRRKGILGGVPLGRFNRNWQDLLLIAVTEKRTKEELDLLVDCLKELPTLGSS